MHLVHRNTSGPLPTSCFDLIGDAGQVLGFTQVRHRPSQNAYLPKEAGNHIYYEIAEAHRGKGHGKTLMALALREALRIGLDRVRLTVEDENKISRRIIEGSGGCLIGEFASTEGVKYWLFEISLL